MNLKIHRGVTWLLLAGLVFSAARSYPQKQLAAIDSLKTELLKKTSAAAYYELGWLYLQVHEYASAREQLVQCLRLQPQGPFAARARATIGFILYRQEQYSAALKELNKILVTQPAHPEAGQYLQLTRLMLEANLSFENSLFQTAANQYQQVLQLDSANTVAREKFVQAQGRQQAHEYLRLASTALERHQFESARQLIQEAEKLWPNHPELSSMRAMLQKSLTITRIPPKSEPLPPPAARDSIIRPTAQSGVQKVTTQTDSLVVIDTVSGKSILLPHTLPTSDDSVRQQSAPVSPGEFNWFRDLVWACLGLVLIGLGGWQLWRRFRTQRPALPATTPKSASACVVTAPLSASKGWIGKYKIISELEKGGMGLVVKAQHPHLNRPVVIKSILPEFIARPDMRQRLMREANILFELDHPHIVRVTDLIQEGEQLYLVMQFIEGQNLKQRLLKNGPFPASEAVRFLIQALDALSYLHARGIIHRDIKPQNIMLEQPTNQIKLVDFGIVKPLKLAEAFELTSSSRVAGTPAYMSPEQLLNDEIDTRSDIFSTGIVLYEILAGFNPFEKFQISVIQAILQKNPLPLDQINADISPALVEIGAQMLQKDRTQRYQTADAVIQDLSRLTV